MKISEDSFDFESPGSKQDKNYREMFGVRIENIEQLNQPGDTSPVLKTRVLIDSKKNTEKSQGTGVKD
jgi:hypothetical protein